MGEKGSIDDLLAESRRIRDELLKTVGRLEAFTDQLASEVARLSVATGDSDERVHQGTTPAGDAGGGPADRVRRTTGEGG